MQSETDTYQAGIPTRWLVGIDCDGVLTDYKCYFDATGKLFKVFNSKDSYAFKDLLKAGHLPYIITADKDGLTILQARAQSWGVEAMASVDKRATLHGAMKRYAGRFDKVCFVGNGPEDLVVIDMVDCFFAPADARFEVARHPKVQLLDTAGGDGIMDEVHARLSKQ
jgi:YrbI family 3-deoxy-D-manno-octulosonate 8-phosphate phosphatase